MKKQNDKFVFFWKSNINPITLWKYEADSKSPFKEKLIKNK